MVFPGPTGWPVIVVRAVRLARIADALQFLPIRVTLACAIAKRAVASAGVVALLLALTGARLVANRSLRVAPFKAQNTSNNAAVAHAG
jgi:hypothetical protein